jgi:single-stranded-DNA-specific exonuclease
MFSDVFTVKSQRLIKEKHLKLVLEKNGQQLEAIQFNMPDSAQSAPAKIRAAYELAIDEFNGVTKVSVVIRHWEAVASG